MDKLLIANFKDDVLGHLSQKSNKHEILSMMFFHLKTYGLPDEVVRGYLDEMAKDGVISILILSGSKATIGLTDKGVKFIYEGGYSNAIKKELEDASTLQIDNQKYREKTDLEIVNLKASINNFRITKRISILALVISILSVGISIILKII